MGAIIHILNIYMNNTAVGAVWLHIILLYRYITC